MFDIAKLQQKDREVAATQATSGLKLTPLEKKREEAFAGIVSAWQDEKGRENFAASNAKMENAKRLLQSSDNISGPNVKLLRNVPLVGRAFLKAKQVEADVRNAVTDMLRATLGAQFTENEGERIFKQTFDPQQQENVNLARLSVLQKSLQDSAAALEERIAYSNTHGTLVGFKGSAGSLKQLIAEFDKTFTAALKGKAEGKNLEGLTLEAKRQLALEKARGGKPSRAHTPPPSEEPEGSF